MRCWASWSQRGAGWAILRWAFFVLTLDAALARRPVHRIRIQHPACEAIVRLREAAVESNRPFWGQAGGLKERGPVEERKIKKPDLVLVSQASLPIQPIPRGIP